MKTCTILGTEIAVTTMEETVRYIEEHMEELRGKYICVSNVHTTVTAYEDESYRKVQNGAAFALPDGKPLSLYSKKHGFPEAERVTGPDLMGELFARDNGLTHYFYGGSEATIRTLREKLPKEYPHLKIAGMVSPPYRPLTKEEDAAQVEAMNASGADIIWIGLGAPKQERYMFEHQGLTQGVMVGVGAGFDYYAGTIRARADVDAEVELRVVIPSDAGSQAPVQTLFCDKFQVPAADTWKREEEQRREKVMTEAKAKYQYMDVARGLALLLVMISHAHGLSSFLIFYYIQIFFIISGYIYKPGRSYRDNIRRKAKRLLVPYFGYSALLWCAYALIRRDMGEMKQSLFGIFYSRFCLYKNAAHTENVYLLDIANGAMWYLTAFFVTCLLFYLIADKCLASAKTMAVTSVVLVAVTMALNELPILLPWSMDIVPVAALLMLVGAWMRRYEFFERKWNPLWIFVTLVVYVGTVVFNGRLNMSIREYGRFDSFSVPFFLVISLTGSTLCIWFCKWIGHTKVGSGLAYIGNHTIELMCLHMFGLEMFEVIASHVIPVQELTGVAEWIYVAVRVGAAVCGSLLFGVGVSWVKKKRGR